jgi:DNA primase
MDALAITLGSSGTAAGIAPMGTALTRHQINLLCVAIDIVDGRDRIIVATDSDPAGWTAAQRSFWHLTAADIDPRYVYLPDGMDPSELFQRHGTDAITSAIEQAAPLGDAMIDQFLATTGSWSETYVRQHIVHHAAQILCARGPETWRDAITTLRDQLHLDPGILEHQVISESVTRDLDRQAYAYARIHETNHEARRQATHSAQAQTRARTDRLVLGVPSARSDKPLPPPVGPDPAGPSK